jgi:nicotinamidase-related amidase
MALIERKNAVLIVVDLQERLLEEIRVADAIVARTVELIRAARELEVPILCTEQYPKGLGPTVSAVRDELGEARIEKVSFGCFGEEKFVSAWSALERRQLVIAGAETHVCVLQTALAARAGGYDAFVVTDAVAARKKSLHKAGLARMAVAGVEPVTAEMVVFELLGEAGTPEFKRLLPLIKRMAEND